MKKILRLGGAAAAIAMLAGCAGNIKLVEDGKVHMGSYNQLSKEVQVNIDGVPYKGTFVQGATAGFGTTVSGQRVATGTFVTTDGGGQALLTSPEGKVLRCVFGSVVAWRGQGQCQTNDGRLFDMLIGG